MYQNISVQVLLSGQIWILDGFEQCIWATLREQGLAEHFSARHIGEWWFVSNLTSDKKGMFKQVIFAFDPIAMYKERIRQGSEYCKECEARL